MTLFDRLVSQALQARPELTAVRTVVEKELLHHDILREMASAGLLTRLTFIGGTCLRACHGSARLSENLDFAGGAEFTCDMLSGLADILVTRLEARYGLKVTVSDPIRESLGVDTWKISVVTHPGQRDMPAQRIHIDICAVPSHDRRPMMLRNFYGVDMGTAGLILQAQSREEILADKLIALAFRPNRIKNRDLWDIAWLKQQGVELPLMLIPSKLKRHRRATSGFRSQLGARVSSLTGDSSVRRGFAGEMRRFLPTETARATVEQDAYWDYLTDLLRHEGAKAMGAA
jgi:predicted nucleotidyltransferase component of viral defense system